MPEEQGLEKYKNRLRIILSEGQENGTKIKRLKSLAHDLVDNSKNMDRENRKYMLFLAEECVEEIEKLQKKEENSIVKKDVKANQHTGDLLQNNDAKEFVKKLNPAIFQTDFDHIAGLDDVKRIIINQVIKAGENPDIAKMYGIMGRNILLFGPPGTGKTSIAQAISNKTQFPMVTITPSYILDNKFGKVPKKTIKLLALFQDTTLTLLHYTISGTLANSPMEPVILKTLNRMCITGLSFTLRISGKSSTI